MKIISLEEAKNTTFSELVIMYQNQTDGLLIDFKKFENEIKSIKKDEVFHKTQNFLNLFTVFNEAFYYHYIKYIENCETNNSTPSDLMRDKYRLFIEACTLNINRINALYISPFTIRKANRSILWGKISVAIGIIAIFYSAYISFTSNESVESIKQNLIKQEIIINEHKTILYPLDSLAKANNTNVLYLIKNLPKATNNPLKNSPTYQTLTNSVKNLHHEAFRHCQAMN